MDTLIFFKQKTAYEVGTGDWSSDVCSSDRQDAPGDDTENWNLVALDQDNIPVIVDEIKDQEIGRASCRERV